MRAIMIILLLFWPLLSFGETCKSSLYPLKTPSGYSHAKYAPLPIERWYDGKSFVASIDNNDDDDSKLGGSEAGDYLTAPQWVAVHLKRYLNNDHGSFAPGFERPSPWYKIPLFNEERKKFKINKRVDKSYAGVGNQWNRGHLAQRADANRMGQKYGCNTHVFANAVPQAAKFNQGIWLGLENYISGLANQIGEVWVVSGPIYSSKLRWIGDARELKVAIPDELFKVVIWEENNHLSMLAFIYPNVPAVGNREYKTGRCSADKSYNHSKFITTIKEIEEKTGLTFFQNYTKQQRNQFIQAKASNLPEVISRYRVGNCR